eukprot:8093541-Pyramimonas_sp.AAC.1
MALGPNFGFAVAAFRCSLPLPAACSWCCLLLLCRLCLLRNAAARCCLGLQSAASGYPCQLTRPGARE